MKYSEIFLMLFISFGFCWGFLILNNIITTTAQNSYLLGYIVGCVVVFLFQIIHHVFEEKDNV